MVWRYDRGLIVKENECGQILEGRGLYKLSRV